MEPNELVDKVRKAQQIYSTFTQAQVDLIFKEAALAANHARVSLAKMTVEETGMGIVEDKVIKNNFAAEYIYNYYKNSKTCGVVEKDDAFGIEKRAEPLGVVAAIIPTTNPTSTAIFKILLALKTRNGIVLSPHPRAKNSTIEAGRIIHEAAVNAGAPEGIIAWIDTPSTKASTELMQAADIILATGGPGMVHAAYSSGTPAIGVGSGNTPVLLDETADIKTAVNSILLSKTFDNGMICASEQAILVPAGMYEEVKKEFVDANAYILTPDEADKIRRTIMIDGKLNSAIVGQSAFKIAEMAGVKVAEDTKILIGEAQSTDPSEPFAHEKLSPILAMYKIDSFADGLQKANKLIHDGGMGHTSVIYADERKAKARIDEFATIVPTGRVLVNTPASQGGIGDLYNFKLTPSLTLGCGSWGKNSVSENVGVKHLLNIKTIAQRRENMLWFKVPKKIYFKFGCLPVALRELRGKKRVVIVTDSQLAQLNYTDYVTKVLEEINVEYRIFSDVHADPTLSCVQKGAALMREYKPDVIVALGGGSAMDAGKIMWVMYEYPDADFKDLAMTFLDIRKRVAQFPEMGKLAEFWAVSTSAGTGSEVTPFAVITEDETNMKYPLADYELTPSVAVVDPELMLSMPASLTAASGIDTVTHAMEAYVSVMATDYTSPLALQALKLCFKYLPESVRGGADAVEAKENMANAACLAGMAFANAFLGVCHSMAHKLGAAFHIPHGVATAMFLHEVIRFNATNKPGKMTAFSQYKYPNAINNYAEIADALGFTSAQDSPETKVEKLIEKVQELKAAIGIKPTIADYGIGEEEFLRNLDWMTEEAFNDQCTGTNPRYPLMKEIKEIYLKGYYGQEKYEKLYPNCIQIINHNNKS